MPIFVSHCWAAETYPNHDIDFDHLLLSVLCVAIQSSIQASALLIRSGVPLGYYLNHNVPSRMPFPLTMNIIVLGTEGTRASSVLQRRNPVNSQCKAAFDPIPDDLVRWLLLCLEEAETACLAVGQRRGIPIPRSVSVQNDRLFHSTASWRFPKDLLVRSHPHGGTRECDIRS